MNKIPNVPVIVGATVNISLVLIIEIITLRTKL